MKLTRFGKVIAFVAITLVARNVYGTTVSQDRAREIMGRNFFGTAEATRYFGIHPSQQQLAALADVPFTETTLESCKNTHVLVAVFPLSILEIRGRVDRKLFYYGFLSYEGDWYNGRSFARDRGEISWQLVRRTPIPNSTNKTYNEQLTLLTKDEEVPTARVMVYATIGHLLSTGEWLFPDSFLRVRCSDIALLDSERVLIGRSDSPSGTATGFALFAGRRIYLSGSPDDSFGLCIGGLDSSRRRAGIGLASVRKPD